MTTLRPFEISGALVLTAALLMSGCKKEEARASAEPSPAPVTPVPKQAALPTDPQEVMAAIQREARERADGARVELAVEVLKEGGVVLEGVKQVLAATVRARYCVAGNTPAGRAVAVCEYATPDAAQEGRRYSLAAFKSAPNRAILVKDNLTLTLSGGEGSIQEAEDVKKLATLFEGVASRRAEQKPSQNP